MVTLFAVLLFIKVFILFFAIQIVLKNLLNLYKALRTDTPTGTSDRELLYIGLSIAYIFACIFA